MSSVTPPAHTNQTVNDTKVCSTCEVPRPLNEFYMRTEGQWRRSVCRSCYAEANRSRRADPQVRAERAVAEKEARTWDERRTSAALKSLYGITVEDVRTLLQNQGGICPICLRDLDPTLVRVPGKNRTTRVDHDHKTGKVRGLLHHPCNVLLGLAHDDPDVFRRAIVYLEGQ